MKLATVFTLVALLGNTAPVLAQHQGMDNHTATPGASASLHMADGEVRKVDKGAKKITLKHGEIKNLGMAPMTMVYQVKDAALLDKVKAGDKVRFTADQINGAYVVLSIEPMKH